MRDIGSLQYDDAGFAAGITEDAVFLSWNAMASFLIRDGCEIVIESAPGAETDFFRIPLLGAAMGILLHQRGQLVLHASAVAVEENAVMFLGNKGWGKSTLAAALAARGHTVLSDDVVALDKDDQGGPTVLPAFPQIKLWPNSVEALGGDPEELPRLSALFEKRHYDVSRQFARTALPLKRIFLLGVGDAVKVDAVPAQEAVIELIRHSYSARFATHLLTGKKGGRHLLQCSSLARSVPICRIERPADLSLLAAVARLVEETLHL